MLDPLLIGKLKKTGIFLVAYTIIFAAFFSTISYTFPFVLAFIIAYLTKPLTAFFITKLRMSRGLSSLLSTILSFTLITLLITLLIMKIATESKDILASLPGVNINTITTYFMSSLDTFNHFYESLDPNISSQLQSQLSSVASGLIDIMGVLLDKLVKLAMSLPLIFMVILVTLLATFFISKDLPSIQKRFFNTLSPSGQDKLKYIWSESSKMLFQYIKSYGIIIFITFLLTWVGFGMLGIKYSFMLSLLSGILDILPILGIAAVYIPLAIYYWIIGDHVIAIFIFVLYLVTTTVRHIVEPKIVSQSLNLHPVAVLAAIFIGLQAYGLLGMVYLIFLMLFYNIFKKVKIL